MPVTPTKTIGSSLLAWQDQAAATVLISSVIDVSTAWAIALNILLARAISTVFVGNAPQLRIEASGKASGNDAWVPLLILTPAVGASIAQTTLNGAVSAAATSFVVTSATNLSAGQLAFVGHTSDVTKYELCRIKSVSGTTITPEDAVTYAHDTGALVTGQAESFFPALDCSAYSRLRIVVDNMGNATQGLKLQVLYNIFNSF